MTPPRTLPDVPVHAQEEIARLRAALEGERRLREEAERIARSYIAGSHDALTPPARRSDRFRPRRRQLAGA